MIDKTEAIVTLVFTAAPILMVTLLDLYMMYKLQQLDREHPLPTPEEVKRHFKL